MDAPATVSFLLGLMLLVLANLGGGKLLHQTYLSAKQSDQSVILQGKEIAQSIAITLQTQDFSGQAEKLQGIAQKLISIEDIRGILFIDSSGKSIATSGKEFPNELILDVKKAESYGLRREDILYISTPIINSEYSFGEVTSQALPEGFILVALSASEAMQRQQLLFNYCIAGSSLLLLLNIMLITQWWRTRKRRIRNRNTPEHMRRKFDKGYQILEHSIGLQQRAIDQARNEALKTSEIKSQFLANMSHEIRTPLNAIIGFTDLLLKTRLDNKQLDFLSTIRKSSLGLLQIINDILDFSKIEAGKVALDEISMNLRDTIDDVLAVLAPAAHQKKIELVCIMYSEVPNLIFADPLRLKQILTNLISNSIKFTTHGSVIVRAMLERTQENESIIKISVSDTGIGIAEKKQEALFHAFTQADTSTTRQFGGTGLGLVIAKQLAQQMRGEIGVNSLPGKGATFWFTFKARPIEPSRQSPTLKPLPHYRIAIYDPHPLSRLAMARCLKQWQIVTQSAVNLEDLEQIIGNSYQSNPFDLTIISLGFTNNDWDAARQTLNKLNNSYQCPTILIQNTVTEDETETALAEHASTTLSKPIGQCELYKTICKLMNDDQQNVADPITAQATIQKFVDQHPSVLAIDDNPANLKLVQELLSNLGANVTVASSGQQALNKLKLESFDIIYMDIQMPGMDGVETTRRIRSIPSAYRDIPIIALTAHALESEKESLLVSGLDDYLSKPVTMQQLLDTILKWTDIKASVIQTQNISQNEKTTASTATIQDDKSVVDLDLALKLAAGKKELAKELFDMLLDGLPEEHSAITQAFASQDHDRLLQNVHRLHGATRYCGVPALQSASALVETSLKQHPEKDLGQAMKQLNYEIKRLTEWAEKRA